MIDLLTRDGSSTSYSSTLDLKTSTSSPSSVQKYLDNRTSYDKIVCTILFSSESADINCLEFEHFCENGKILIKCHEILIPHFMA